MSEKSSSVNPSGSINSISGRAARSKVKGVAVHIDDGVARRQQHDGVIFGEELAIFAKAAGETLLIVRRPHNVLAADHLALGAGVRIDARGGKGCRPAAAALVALLQVGVAKGVCPVGDGKGHHARILFAVVVHIAQRALRCR
jgi:hypothetical protein